MPFNGHRSFVYRLAIEGAVNELNEESLQDSGHSIELRAERADEVPAHSTDKVAQIRSLIHRSDVVITDISGLNPNVMWELGYSTAMDKLLIVLCEKGEKVPFNVSTAEIIFYEFSFDGLTALKSQLVNTLKSITPNARFQKDSLVVHEEYLAARQQVMATLTKIPQNSLLKRLALNELSRIGKRFEELGKGTFILRNEKPYAEISEYYCAYLSQLKDDQCSFDVVSNLDFWNEITDEGKDFRYVEANLAAVRNGAKVQRVILVDSTRFPDRSLSGSPLYKQILRKFDDAAKGADGRLATRLLFTDSYLADRTSFGNFGILKKESELLLFKPRYAEDGRMTKTEFIYGNDGNARISHVDSRLAQIEEHENKFRAAWDQGVELSEEHYGASQHG